MSVAGAHLRARSIRGSSLLELLTVLAIAATLISVAIPSISSTSSNANGGAAVRMLEFDLARLRSEALSAGVRAIMAPNSGGAGYRAGLDVLPYGSTPSIDQQVFTSSLPTGITATFSDNIIFDSRGFPVDELGQTTNYTVALSAQGELFCTATISVSGNPSFSCGQEAT